MQLELIILFQVLGFIFLALGIVPYRKDVDSGSLPLANKVIFLILSSILFFLIGMLGSAYTVQHCYIANETMVTASSTINVGVCDLIIVDDPVLGYINLGMGWISILLAIIVMIIALSSKNDRNYRDAEGYEDEM